MAFAVDWKTTDGRDMMYRNFPGMLVEETLLMDLRNEPMIDPASIRIAGQPNASTVRIVADNGEEIQIA